MWPDRPVFPFWRSGGGTPVARAGRTTGVETIVRANGTAEVCRQPPPDRGDLYAHDLRQRSPVVRAAADVRANGAAAPGGSAAVWNTAVVFYQCVLLAGYAYAYALTRWISLRRQFVLHLAVLPLPLLVLPIDIPADWLPAVTAAPVLSLLALLSIAVGLPFFVVSTTSPLLQRWFVESGHTRAADPYFLYGASNLGSLLSLLGYPLVVERWLRLSDQGRWWAGGYLLLMALVGACVAIIWRRAARSSTAAPPHEELAPAPTLHERLMWLGLAAAPVSLMLSVTTYLSTDISAIPAALGDPAGALSADVRPDLCVPAAGAALGVPGAHTARPGGTHLPHCHETGIDGMVVHLGPPSVVLRRRNGVSRRIGPATAGARVRRRVLPVGVARRRARRLVQFAGRTRLVRPGRRVPLDAGDYRAARRAPHGDEYRKRPAQSRESPTGQAIESRGGTAATKPPHSSPSSTSRCR